MALAAPEQLNVNESPSCGSKSVDCLANWRRHIWVCFNLFSA